MTKNKILNLFASLHCYTNDMIQNAAKISYTKFLCGVHVYKIRFLKLPIVKSYHDTEFLTFPCLLNFSHTTIFLPESFLILPKSSKLFHFLAVVQASPFC
jgi:hypothetical protein